MPSVHIIWSGWSGLTLAFLARRCWVRVLGVLYPLATFTVILATANHFLTDALAGAATLALGFVLQQMLTGRPAYLAPSTAHTRRWRDRRPQPGRLTPGSDPGSTKAPRDRRQDGYGAPCPCPWLGDNPSVRGWRPPTGGRW